jgi:hypothetical protein
MTAVAGGVDLLFRQFSFGTVAGTNIISLRWMMSMLVHFVVASVVSAPHGRHQRRRGGRGKEWRWPSGRSDDGNDGKLGEEEGEKELLIMERECTERASSKKNRVVQCEMMMCVRGCIQYLYWISDRQGREKNTN